MTRPVYALDYDASTTTELRAFLKARTGIVTKKLRQKTFYVDSLRQADQDANFRFLDLLPELRNYVYRELLDLGEKKWFEERRSCFPQILAVSKQLYLEAYGILYGTNDFQIDLQASYTSASEGNHATLADADHVFFAVGGKSSLDLASWKWPNMLRRVHRLQINLSLENDSARRVPRSPIFRSVNYLLYSIFSFLGEENSLKQLHLSVDASKFPPSNEISYGLLWPLLKLNGPDIIEITGVPEHVTSRLLNDMSQRDEQPSNILRKALKSLAKAVALKAIINEAGGLSHFKEDVIKRTYPMEAVLRMDGYVDDHRDAWLASCTTDLESLLTSGTVSSIKQGGKRKMDRIAELMKKLD